MELYCKVEDNFVPIELSVNNLAELEGHLVVIKVGDDANPATAEDLQNVAGLFQSDERISGIKDAVFFVMGMPLTIIAAGELEEVETQVKNGRSLKEIIEGE